MKKETSKGNKFAPEALNPEVLNPSGRGGVVILCEHASKVIPPDMDNLGLSGDDLTRHIAWDIGAEAVTRALSQMMDVPAVIHTVSRLVIDCNREPDHPTLVPTSSDGSDIPGNQNLSKAEIDRRRDQYYTPFHAAADQVIQDQLAAGVTPLVIGMHSFTPVMGADSQSERPWQIGFLWNKDHRLAQALIGALQRETTLTIGDNQPYSGKDLYYTMQAHGADHGLPQTTVEIRQDLLATPDQAQQWAALLADALDGLLGRHDMGRL